MRVRAAGPSNPSSSFCWCSTAGELASHRLPAYAHACHIPPYHGHTRCGPGQWSDLLHSSSAYLLMHPSASATAWALHSFFLQARPAGVMAGLQYLDVLTGEIRELRQVLATWQAKYEEAITADKPAALLQVTERVACRQMRGRGWPAGRPVHSHIW